MDKNKVEDKSKEFANEISPMDGIPSLFELEMDIDNKFSSKIENDDEMFM